MCLLIKRLLAGLFVGTALSAVTLPASAAVENNHPGRWNTSGALWSTSQDAFKIFMQSGEVTDRGLERGLYRSGFTAEELREGMKKSYSVDFLGVSRFLYSDGGVKFLKNQSLSYNPTWGDNTYAVQALRSAIMADARDGQISSAGIIDALPTDMRLADFCNTNTGAEKVCAECHCQGDDYQRISLLTLYVFLPACIQANQMADNLAVVHTIAPAPATAGP
ncbi:MAG: alpha/beta hydrolase [Cyanobacteria bacterium]|nr:alpha/beta hydrolase [Cyanobacteriota bacterium]MDA1246033.1 alpha/beta hydrolase [Cyanobacteriota bacterium]